MLSHRSSSLRIVRDTAARDQRDNLEFALEVASLVSFIV